MCSAGNRGAHPELLLDKPHGRSERLINATMWKHIIVQVGLLTIAPTRIQARKPADVVVAEAWWNLAPRKPFSTCWPLLLGAVCPSARAHCAPLTTALGIFPLQLQDACIGGLLRLDAAGCHSQAARCCQIWWQYAGHFKASSNCYAVLQCRACTRFSFSFLIIYGAPARLSKFALPTACMAYSNVEANGIDVSLVNQGAVAGSIYNPLPPSPPGNFNPHHARCNKGPCLNLCCNRNVTSGTCLDNLVAQGGHYMPSKCALPTGWPPASYSCPSRHSMQGCLGLESAPASHPLQRLAEHCWVSVPLSGHLHKRCLD